MPFPLLLMCPATWIPRFGEDDHLHAFEQQSAPKASALMRLRLHVLSKAYRPGP